MTHPEEKPSLNVVDPCTRNINEKRKADTEWDEGHVEQGKKKHVAKEPKVCSQISHMHETQLKIILCSISKMQFFEQWTFFCFRRCL